MGSNFRRHLYAIVILQMLISFLIVFVCSIPSVCHEGGVTLLDVFFLCVFDYETCHTLSVHSFHITKVFEMNFGHWFELELFLGVACLTCHYLSGGNSSRRRENGESERI